MSRRAPRRFRRLSGGPDTAPAAAPGSTSAHTQFCAFDDGGADSDTVVDPPFVPSAAVRRTAAKLQFPPIVELPAMVQPVPAVNVDVAVCQSDQATIASDPAAVPVTACDRVPVFVEFSPTVPTGVVVSTPVNTNGRNADCRFPDPAAVVVVIVIAAEVVTTARQIAACPADPLTGSVSPRLRWLISV